ncbi:hypothetical protein FRC08_017818 [Ceratobasidium sp. 394]|nr:hypothetical protein FRC08_017818 [Ceratobasidium sp. 394]
MDPYSPRAGALLLITWAATRPLGPIPPPPPPARTPSHTTSTASGPDDLGTTDDVIRAPALRVALADPASRLFITGSQRTRVLSNPVCFVTEYNWDIAVSSCTICAPTADFLIQQRSASQLHQNRT